MSATGATGPAPTEGSVTAAGKPQPLDQTALEMATGRKRNEHFANLASRPQTKPDPTGKGSGTVSVKTGAKQAQPTVPPQKTTRAADVIPFDVQNAKPAAAFAALTEEFQNQAAKSAKQQSEQQSRPNADQAQQGGISSLLNAAESYIRAGWHVFPGKRRKKTPKTGWSWTKDKLTLADVPQYFDKNQHNVLVALGKASNNLTDIDLDWSEAVAAADLIFKDLPSFGRSGKLRSHRLAICGDIKTRKYLLPQSLANDSRVGGEHAMCIAEIRGSGSYTVFPGSEHETGQKIEWTNADVDNTATLQAIDANALFKSMGLLSFIAFCMRFFPAVGTRCDFMMAVAGALARAGYDGGVIQQIVQRISAFNHDEGDNGNWRVAAESVTGKLDDGKEVTGLPTLIKIFRIR